MWVSVLMHQVTIPLDRSNNYYNFKVVMSMNNIYFNTSVTMEM